MLFDAPFYGYLAMGLVLKEDKTLKIPTMATDGRNLYYDPKFVEDTPLAELQGCLAHELAHCFLNHIPRRLNRLPEKWNYAIDYAANELVLKEFLLPKGVLYDKKFADMHAEAIYNHIPDPDEDGGGGTLDSHEKFDDWGKGDGEGDGEGQGDDGSGIEQEWREAVAQAANQARARGKLPSHLAQAVGDLLQPKLDWKSILREMITSCAKNDFRLMPPNKKHLYRNIYLPGITGEEISIAVAIDTSGSISDEDMKAFLSEVKGICDTYAEYTIYLMTGDAEIHQKWELHPMDPLPNILEGRGGTDFRPAFKEAEKLDNITSLVYLTDLDGTMPEKAPYRFSTIWVATSNLKAPFGMVIRYPKMKD